jgi:hypothetical protein
MGIGFLILLKLMGPLLGSYLLAGMILGVLFAIIDLSVKQGNVRKEQKQELVEKLATKVEKNERSKRLKTSIEVQGGERNNLILFLEKYLLRPELNLSGKWWHRFLYVIYIGSFLILVGIVISSAIADNQLPRYTKVGMLSDRMDSEVRLIGDLIEPGEKIAVYEDNLYGAYNGKKLYDGNGGWLLKQEYYCSRNVSDQVEKIATETGSAYFCGNMCFVSGEDFKTYLKQNKVSCISVNNYNPIDNSETRKKLMWGLEADNMAVWKVSLLSSIVYVLQMVLSVTVAFLLIVVVYYKIFIYVIYGKRR